MISATAGIMIATNYVVGVIFKIMLIFKILSAEQEGDFISLLPDDWAEELIPFREKHRDNLCFYGVYEHKKIIGGGIIFSGAYPASMGASLKLDKELQMANPYLGFFWIQEASRGLGAGTFFMKKIKEIYNNNNLWLICAESLVKYYEKQGLEEIDSWIDEEEEEKQFLMRIISS